MKKVLVSLVLIIVVVVLAMVVYVFAAWDRNFDAPYPAITASTDSAVIARGKYLVYGPAHCAYCHVPQDKLQDVAAGKDVSLTGGWTFSIPPGTFRAPNITSDVETGLGGLTDAQLARSLRYSVDHDNKFMIPVMPFQELSDEDLTAVISFIRTQKPIKNEIQKTDYSFLGKALLAFGVLKPVGPQQTPPVSVPIDSTAGYGSYLAHSVANCIGCHTKRDLKTGDFAGPAFAGGFQMEAEGDPDMKGYVFITPNITPDPETGIMANWDEQTFIDRFQAGRLQEGSPMPWEAFATMHVNDLKALYRFLQNIDPVKYDVSQVVYAPGEKLPE